jgi:hypothetical protein
MAAYIADIILVRFGWTIVEPQDALRVAPQPRPGQVPLSRQLALGAFNTAGWITLAANIWALGAV